MRHAKRPIADEGVAASCPVKMAEKRIWPCVGDAPHAGTAAHAGTISCYLWLSRAIWTFWCSCVWMLTDQYHTQVDKYLVQRLLSAYECHQGSSV